MFVLMVFCGIVFLVGIIVLIYNFGKLYQTKRNYEDVVSKETIESRQKRTERANTIKQRAIKVNTICQNNNYNFDKPLVSTNYCAEEQIKIIMYEIRELADVQEKVNSIADKLSMEKGNY